MPCHLWRFGMLAAFHVICAATMLITCNKQLDVGYMGGKAVISRALLALCCGRECSRGMSATKNTLFQDMPVNVLGHCSGSECACAHV